MSQVIDAIYENGVFKPLQNVPLKERQRVEIKIISLDDWQLRFQRIIKKIQKNTAQYSSQEIESNISQAIYEVRKKKHDR